VGVAWSTSHPNCDSDPYSAHRLGVGAARVGNTSARTHYGRRVNSGARTLPLPPMGLLAEPEPEDDEDEVKTRHSRSEVTGY